MPRSLTGKKSGELFERAKKMLVGGVNSPVRAFQSVGGAPVFIERGKGAGLYDVDGRSYVDYCLSWGPLILGHAHPEVERAAREALERGSSFGACHRLEVDWAEAVLQAVPHIQKIRFTSSGTEAVMSALRLARAVTGRRKILKFSGGYHGHVDSLLVAAGSGASTFGHPDSAGVPEEWVRDTLVQPYNDTEALERIFDSQGSQIAAAIVEPVAANMGVVLPSDAEQGSRTESDCAAGAREVSWTAAPGREGFLGTLRRLASKHGALLIFDEVVTGFRLRYGAAAQEWGIVPDLTILGKIIGGGFPAGAYGGREEVMRWVSPEGPVYQAGTLSGNPVAAAAGLATFKLLKKTLPYSRLKRLTEDLTDGIRKQSRESGVPVQVNSIGSMFTVFFTSQIVKDYDSAKASDAAAFGRFFQGILRRGVYFPPSQFETAFLSAAHTSKEIEKTLDAIRAAFKEI